MSSKKEKLIESATRYLLKGQVDRAIREYEQIVSLDPGDVNNRRKLAELLARDNRTAEAIEHFTAVAQYFVKNSFYLKAIAVYKQIQKLSPPDPAISLALADLNLKQGLTGNAMAEFSDALALYERDRKLSDVQRVLQMMQEIDADNPAIRLKSAEILLSLDRHEEAFSAFVELALMLERQGKEIPLGQLRDRVVAAFPPARFYLAVAERFFGEGDLSRAERHAKSAIASAGDDPRPWFLLLKILQKRGDASSALQLCHQMIERFPEEPSIHRTLIGLMLDRCEAEEALRVVQSSMPILHQAGDDPFLIETLQQLERLLPDDPRPLELLCDILRDSDGPLLAGVRERLERLRPAMPGPLPTPSAPSGAAAGESELDLEVDTSAFLDEKQDAADDQLPDFGEIDLGEFFSLGEAPSAPAVNGGEAPPRRKRVKLGVEVDEGDVGTIYDLAIAYKEMGLYDEAIEQLELVSRHPRRRVDAMTLQGLCHREKGDRDAAEKMFLLALTQPAERHERLCALYELARIRLEKGEREKALSLLHEIRESDPDYRDTVQLIEGVEGTGSR